MDDNQGISVSVIVPVFNDSQRLRKCLNALEKQTIDTKCFEIIVVDNGSSNGIQKLIEEFPNVVFTYENHPGSYFARNKGIQISTGAIIAFTDSDCIPSIDWLEKGLKWIKDYPNCGLIAGKVELFFKDPYKPNAVELYETITAFTQEKNILQKKYGVTANLFTRKEVIEEVGLFNQNLKSGGDKEWGQRVFEKKFTIHYADDVCVYHPARASFSEIAKKSIRLTHGFYHRECLSKNFDSTQVGNYRPTPTLSEWIRYVLPSRWVINNAIKNKNYSFMQNLKIITVMLFVKYIRLWRLILLFSGVVKVTDYR